MIAVGKIHDQDAPHAPGEAYYDVARWLGDDWFKQPTPQVGRLLVIMGRDGVETRWHVDRLTASRLADWVRAQQGLACTRIIPFDRRHKDGGVGLDGGT